MNSKLKNAVRHMVSLAFGDRVVSIRGEAGQRFWFRPGEYPSLLRGIRFFEADYRRGWKQLLQPKESIADIGANIGLTVQRFYGLCQGQCCIQAFEPSPWNLNLLRRNVRELGGNNITIFEYAVSDRDGQAVFTENIGHGGLSRLAALDATKGKNAPLWKHENQIEVVTVTLDNLLLNGSSQFELPSFLKVDIEGAGGMALKGASRLLEQRKPALFCSFHSRVEIDSVTQIMADHGYKGLTFSKDEGWRECKPCESDGYFATLLTRDLNG